MRHFSRFLLITVSLLAGCSRRPNPTEALAAIRAFSTGLDTVQVEGRVWEDGPPWFSCAEVISKLNGRADTAAVRDPVGNWKFLVLSGWVVLRDSAKGILADPGWCTAKLTDMGVRRATAWSELSGPESPTGTPRRGWSMPLGQRRLAVVGKARAVGTDAAAVDYIVTIAPNVNGIATGAARDTARYVADLQRANGEWRVTRSHPAALR